MTGGGLRDAGGGARGGPKTQDSRAHTGGHGNKVPARGERRRHAVTPGSGQSQPSHHQAHRMSRRAAEARDPHGGRAESAESLAGTADVKEVHGGT